MSTRRALLQAGVLGSLSACGWGPAPQSFTGFGAIGEVTGLALAPEGTLLAVATLAGDVVLFDPATLTPRATRLLERGEQLLQVALGPGSLVLALSRPASTEDPASSRDVTTLLVDDLGTRNRAEVLTVGGRVDRLLLSQEGRVALVATSQGDVRAVDLATASVLSEWPGLAPLDLALAPRGDQLAWATAKEVVLAAPGRTETRALDLAGAERVAFSADGRSLFAVAGEVLARLDLETHAKSSFPLEMAATGVAAAESGAVVVVGHAGLVLLEGTSTRRLSEADFAVAPPRRVVVDAAGRRAFVASAGLVFAYDLSSMALAGVIRDTISDLPVRST